MTLFVVKKKQVHEILTLFVKILHKALILFQQIWGECMISISKAVPAISSSPIHQVAKSSKDRIDRDTSLGNIISIEMIVLQEERLFPGM